MHEIGKTKSEAIDWIQEKLDYARRDVAEETLSFLLEGGLAITREESVLLLEEIPEDELREKSRQAMRSNEMRRNNRVMRRRSIISTQKHRDHKDNKMQKKDSKITSLNYVDSLPDSTDDDKNE